MKTNRLLSFSLHDVWSIKWFNRSSNCAKSQWPISIINFFSHQSINNNIDTYRPFHAKVLSKLHFNIDALQNDLSGKWVRTRVRWLDGVRYQEANASRISTAKLSNYWQISFVGENCRFYYFFRVHLTGVHISPDKHALQFVCINSVEDEINVNFEDMHIL